MIRRIYNLVFERPKFGTIFSQMGLKNLINCCVLGIILKVWDGILIRSKTHMEYYLNNTFK